MYNLVDKFKSNAQTSFEKSTAKSSIKTGKQGKFKLITLQFYKLTIFFYIVTSNGQMFSKLKSNCFKVI